MDVGALLSRLRPRWRFIALAAALAALGAVLAVAVEADRHERTVHFVLHPDATVPRTDIPEAIDVLNQDGPLVQTVVGVLGSDEILRRAATSAGVRLGPGYTLESTVRPGGNIIDSTVAGPDEAVVARLGSGLVGAASAYVDASYAGYTLDRLGIDAGGGGTGARYAEVILLALLVGAALGAALVLVEPRLQPQLQRLGRELRARESLARGRATREQLARGPRARGERTPEPEHCRALTSKGVPCRNRPVDGRGYCGVHLAQGEAGGAQNGVAAMVHRMAVRARREPPSAEPMRHEPPPAEPVRRDDED